MTGVGDLFSSPQPVTAKPSVLSLSRGRCGAGCAKIRWRVSVERSEQVTRGSPAAQLDAAIRAAPNALAARILLEARTESAASAFTLLSPLVRNLPAPDIRFIVPKDARQCIVGSSSGQDRCRCAPPCDRAHPDRQGDGCSLIPGRASGLQAAVLACRGSIADRTIARVLARPPERCASRAANGVGHLIVGELVGRMYLEFIAPRLMGAATSTLSPSHSAIACAFE